MNVFTHYIHFRSISHSRKDLGFSCRLVSCLSTSLYIFLIGGFNLLLERQESVSERCVLWWTNKMLTTMQNLWCIHFNVFSYCTTGRRPGLHIILWYHCLKSVLQHFPTLQEDRMFLSNVGESALTQPRWTCLSYFKECEPPETMPMKDRRTLVFKSPDILKQVVWDYLELKVL